jgi:mono/diheme cytochrome c family protein
VAPRWLTYALVLLGAVSLVPFALIARSRATTSARPRIQVIRDMGKQPKLKTQTASPLFADGRAMRPPVPGTVARGELEESTAYRTGRAGDAWITAFPVPVTERLMQRGRERYDIFCAPCHGLAGYGDGPVSKRADALQEGTWTPPSSYHTDLIRGRQVGHLFNTITYGIRTMPAYGSQIPVLDRWAIVLYMRALQRSQDASVNDVPPELRRQLR